MLSNEAEYKIPRGCAAFRLQAEGRRLEALLRNFIATERSMLTGYRAHPTFATSQEAQEVIRAALAGLEGFEDCLDHEMAQLDPRRQPAGLEQR